MPVTPSSVESSTSTGCRLPILTAKIFAPAIFMLRAQGDSDQFVPAKRHGRAFFGLSSRPAAVALSSGLQEAIDHLLRNSSFHRRLEAIGTNLGRTICHRGSTEAH